MDFDSTKNRLYASWDIHTSCNYRCPYCFFDGKWEESAKHNRYLSVSEWVSHWNKVHEEYGSINIDISGGEPFTYPSFLELISELSKRHTLGISTNLFWEVEPFVNAVSHDRVKLCPSFHPYFAQLDSFLKKIIFLRKNGFEGGINCVAYPPMLEDILIFKKKFEEKGLWFSVLPFRGSYQEIEYPQGYSVEEKRLIAFISRDPLSIEYQLERKRTKGKLCRAGQIYVRIHSDGSFFRCVNSKTMGNIIEGNFRLLENPSPCESEFCDCEFTYLVDK